MKITKMNVHLFSRKYPTPIQNGKYVYDSQNVIMAELETDGGVVGYGWCGAFTQASAAIVAQGLTALADYVVGKDALAPERLWAQMYLPKIFGHKGLATRAISAVDIACWDIMGKAAGLPLYRLLGGYADRVYTYIAGGYYAEGKGLDGLAREMEENLAAGAKAIKMKIGAVAMRDDAERVRVVRETIGPDIDLLMDANNAYLPYQAVRFARMVAQYDLYWFEEPVEAHDIEGHAAVAAATGIPIATGENEYTRYGFRTLIDAKAATILQADAAVAGGITEWMKIAHYAAAHDLPLSPHGDQQIHAHLVAAVPNGLILEYYRPNVNALNNDMFREPLMVSPDGYVDVPQKPGLGVEIDFKALEKYRV